jgi:hypothetical protein
MMEQDNTTAEFESTIVYKDGGPHSRAGGTYDFKGVHSQEELDAALAAGWFKTMGEAVAPKVAENSAAAPSNTSTDEDNKPPTREELEQKAKELEIKFTDKTSDKKLADLIAATLEA